MRKFAKGKFGFRAVFLFIIPCAPATARQNFKPLQIPLNSICCTNAETSNYRYLRLFSKRQKKRQSIYPAFGCFAEKKERSQGIIKPLRSRPFLQSSPLLRARLIIGPLFSLRSMQLLRSIPLLWSPPHRLSGI